MPGDAPAGLAIAGEAYEITAANNLLALLKPAVLRLRYDSTVSSGFDVDSLTIYRWDFETSTWQAQPSQHNGETQEVTTTIKDFGLYTLLGTPNASTRKALYNVCANGANDGSPTHLPIVIR
ncbi:MAG: hypothetical protein AAF629_32750 [Chloroflexota bacterium]